MAEACPDHIVPTIVMINGASMMVRRTFVSMNEGMAISLLNGLVIKKPLDRRARDWGVLISAEKTLIGHPFDR
jgi:hypothetical protein